MTQPATADHEGRKPAARSSATRNPFAALVLFIRQVVAELSKVVTPTRRQLVSYFLVVLGFVLVIMAFATGLDIVFQWLAMWAFNDTGQ